MNAKLKKSLVNLHVEHEHLREKISLNGMDCTVSLCRAIQLSGGLVPENVLTMSIGEFILNIAGQNNIKFIYVHPQDEGGV